MLVVPSGGLCDTQMLPLPLAGGSALETPPEGAPCPDQGEVTSGWPFVHLPSALLAVGLAVGLSGRLTRAPQSAPGSSVMLP